MSDDLWTDVEAVDINYEVTVYTVRSWDMRFDRGYSKVLARQTGPVDVRTQDGKISSLWVGRPGYRDFESDPCKMLICDLTLGETDIVLFPFMIFRGYCTDLSAYEGDMEPDKNRNDAGWAYTPPKVEGFKPCLVEIKLKPVGITQYPDKDIEP